MNENKIGGTEIETALLWPMENDLPLYYTNQMALTVTENEAMIIFGSYLPTGFARQEPKTIKRFLKKTTVNPQVKVVMSKNALVEFYNLLQRQMELIENEESQKEEE